MTDRERHTASRPTGDDDELRRTVLAKAPLILFAFDTEGILILAEGAGLEALGAGPGWVVGQSIFQMYQAASDMVDCCRLALLGESRWVTATFQGRELDTHVIPWWGVDGSIVGGIGVSIDESERARGEDMVRQTAQRFAGIFDHAAIGMGLLDTRGHWVQVNRALCEMLGYTNDELSERTLHDVTHPEDWHIDLEQARKLYVGEIRTYQIEKRYFHRDGRLVWVSTNVSAVQGLAGLPLHYIVQIQDITSRRRSEADLIKQREQLRENEGRLRAITEVATDAIITIDRHTTLMSTNPAAERIFGYTQEDMVGSRLETLVPERYRSLPYGELQRFLDTGTKSMPWTDLELKGLRKDGSEFPMEVSIREFRQSGDYQFAVFVRDITKRKLAEEALRVQATHDDLTGLANRVYLMERLERAISAAGRSGTALALLLMDLDHFKEVNDTFGHGVGDQLLQQVGERLRSRVGDAVTVARLGGDEFAFLLPRTDSHGAEAMARDILTALDTPFTVDGRTFDVGASIGIVLFPEHGTDSSTLLRRVDSAMYMAKRGGMGFGFYRADGETD